jgi:ketosteroid isomerase-like protein
MPPRFRCALFLLWTLAACGPSRRPIGTGVPGARLPTIELPPELGRVLRDYERAWRAGNPGELSALFAEDGFVLSMGQPPVRGRSAIATAYAGAGGDLTLAAIAYSTGDSVGYIIGTFGGADVSTHNGKFVLALKRSSTGRWLIAADMDNPSTR